MIDYKSLSLANQVFETIEKNILDGVYNAGEVISESKLSEELGVSRTPIREALSRLESERLISTTPSGTVVLGITPQDVEDMFFIKKTLEPVIFKLAAQNISEKALKILKQNLDQQEFFASKNDIENLRNLDTEFHDIIYNESGRRVMSAVLSPVHHKLMKFRKTSLEKSNRPSHVIEEHKAIYEALCQRDGEKVSNLMMDHVIHAYENLKKEDK